MPIIYHSNRLEKDYTSFIYTCMYKHGKWDTLAMANLNSYWMVLMNIKLLSMALIQQI